MDVPAPKTRFSLRQFLLGDSAILVGLALAKLIVHLLTSKGYGYFGDELYWLAMTRHLDFGYAEVPPLASYLAAVSRLLLGSSLVAIHILPAIAGAIAVFLAGLTARELGGGRFAQGVAALAVLVAPYVLFVNSVFTYDTFDQLCTMILFYLVVRLLNKETPRRWIVLGVVVGLGAMTKLSSIYTVSALVISMLLTPGRRSFATPWPWLAAAAAAAICAPFVVWQSLHGWPLLTYFHNYAMSPDRPHPMPVAFLVSLAIQTNLFLVPVLLLGLAYLLFHPRGRSYRMLGLMFLILAVFYAGLMRLESRHFVSACFPVMAAGAVWLERLVAAVRPRLISALTWVYLGAVVACTALLAPAFLPILPVQDLVHYWVIRVPAFIRLADYQPGAIPHHFRFSMGWDVMVTSTARAYGKLWPVDKTNCVIWTANYWDASAVEVLGEQYNLPDVVSNHAAYQKWSEDRFRSRGVPSTAIILPTTLGYRPIDEYFDSVVDSKEKLSYRTGFNSFSVYMGYDIPIFIGRIPKQDFLEAWKRNANY